MLRHMWSRLAWEASSHESMLVGGEAGGGRHSSSPRVRSVPLLASLVVVGHLFFDDQTGAASCLFGVGVQAS
jgi:hypothetical protein